MALIKCPECGKEVSDKAQACIHCGYPLSSKKSETQFDNGFYKLTLISYPTERKLETIKGLRLIFGYGLIDAKEISENTPSVLVEGLYINECQRLKSALKKFFAEVEISKDTYSREHNDFFANSPYTHTKCFVKKPQCPHCKSLNVAIQRRDTSIFTMLLGGTKFISVCKDCGQKFKS